MERVIEFINSLNIDKDSYVIVACSGGPDSMMLLHVLHTLNYKVVCAHVNHKTRVETEEEYQFVQNYCDINNILFEGTEITESVSENFENYAREFRYNFFQDLAKKYNTSYLFTAHHGDDLVETVLMRVTRGSSLKGYRGFDKVSKRGNLTIIRPFVYITKEYILNYLSDNNIEYRIDNSNKSDDYTRNRFRNNVLPFLKEEDNDIHLRFIKYNETLKDTYDFISRLVNDFLDKYYFNGKLEINEFNKLDDYLKNKVIEEIFRRIFIDDLYLVNGNHVDKVLEVINCDKPNVVINLVSDLSIVKSYDYLEFKSLKELIDYNLELVDELVLEMGTLKLIDKSIDNSNYEIKLNSKDIKLPLRVRNRKNGDKISIKNMNGTKKVNDIFIDEKLSINDRNRYPILVDNDDNILWIPGLKKSKFDIPFDGLYDIIVRYEKGEKL